MGKKPGTKPIDFDLDELEKLGVMQCTQREVAAWFNCSLSTVKTRFQRAEIRDAFEKGQGRGMISLRRMQMRLAESNAAMAIFLGKNLLNQSDKVEYESQSTHRYVLEIPSQPNGKDLTAETWQQLHTNGKTIQ